MSEIQTTHLPEPIEQPKPYEQLPDEPDKWYGRFYHFCLLGPSRSLRRCFQEVMAEHNTLAHPTGAVVQPLHKGELPESWKGKAIEYNWKERAKAWDDDQRILAVQRSEELLNRIMKATLDALQILMDMMNGVVKDADGNVILVVDPYQIRMAAKTVLSKGLEAIPLLQIAGAGPRPETLIREIWANHPDEPPDK